MAELERLTAPAAQKAAFERYRTETLRLEGIYERLIAPLKTKDSAEIQDWPSLAPPRRKSRAEAAIVKAARRLTP